MHHHKKFLSLESSEVNMGLTVFATALFSSAPTTMSTTITLTALSALLLIVLTVFINALKLPLKARNSYLAKSHSLPPGPAVWPIIGNVPELLRNKPTFRWLHNLLKEMNTEIACVRFGSVHVIPVICPKIGLEFLKEQDALFASRPLTVATDVLSGGRLTTIFPPFGDQWKKMRKVLTSEIISPTRHKWLHDKRMEEADNLVKYVYNHSVSTGIIKIRIAARHYAGNVIRKMVFNKRYFGEGMKDGGPGFEEEEHVEATFTGLQYIYNFCISDYFPFLAGLDLDGQEKQVKKAYKTICKYHDPLIDERIKKWSNANPNNKEEPQDLLDVLVTLKDTNGKPLLSSDEIKAQTAEIMTAAIDNPSNAVEWAMAEMINEPKLLEKAIEELDRVVGKERLVQESDIPRLNFVKACAREAFRLHPIAPFIPTHMAMADTTVAGYFIPKGSHVLLSRMGLGRNPKVWPDEPLKFKPERHIIDESSEVVLTDPNLRFISFSIGRRGCIATNLGTTMTTMLLARLLQGFTWNLPPNVSSIDLSESEDDLFLGTPLLAQAKPRLPLHLYPTN